MSAPTIPPGVGVTPRPTERVLSVCAVALPASGASLLLVELERVSLLRSSLQQRLEEIHGLRGAR